MVKKPKSFWIYLVIAIIVIVGGILIYNFLTDKSTEEGLTPASEEEIEESPGETPPTEEEVGIIEKIKNFFTGGGGGGGGSGGGGSTPSGNGETSPTSDSNICQNAQNGGLCDGLDITYGEGYRTLCCSEHSLCC